MALFADWNMGRHAARLRQRYSGQLSPAFVQGQESANTARVPVREVQPAPAERSRGVFRTGTE